MIHNNKYFKLANIVFLLATTTLSYAASGKKGVGLTESTWGATQLATLGVSWYYNWGPTTALTTPAQFVPMSYSGNSIAKLTTTSLSLLGFNEPDNINQSNMTVSDALTLWPSLVSKAVSIGSPATAEDPVTGFWLTSFMSGAPTPKVDFVTLHWYKGPDVARFKKDVSALCSKFGKPVWVTEFAPQTTSSARSNPTKYTQTQVNSFLNSVISWMEQQSCVQRYAWHDAKSGTSALFNADGTLTETGRAYAAAQ